MDDRAAIQQAISLYSQGCSIPDWDLVVSTFAPDGRWIVPARGLVVTGRDALRGAMSGFVSGFEYFVQINSPAVIAIDGNRATARSLIRECGKFSSREEVLDVTGLYDDDLVRTDEGWKFASRTFTGLGLANLAAKPPTLPG